MGVFGDDREERVCADGQEEIYYEGEDYLFGHGLLYYYSYVG